MKSTIRDRDVLRSLRPSDMIGYLRSAGWAREAEVGDRASLWVNPINSAADVLVPLRRDAVDFPLRVAEVLSALEIVEGRSQEEILKDLISTSADLLRIRTLAVEASNGTISLERGARLIEHVREMVVAAACSTVAPRAYWSRRKPARALEYLDRVRMGQTEHGSYVVTILSPVPPELRTSAQVESPFGRQVMQTLTRAVDSVRNAAQQAIETGDLEPFRAGVHMGVSANLCDALVGLGGINPNTGIELSIAWSKNRAIDHSGPWVGTVASDLLPVIEEASRLFKETEPREEFELFGFVEKLDRSVGQAIGNVTVQTLIEDRPRRVVIELEDADYDIAVTAHRDSRAIRCVGLLVKEGRSHRLRNPRQFELTPLDGEIGE